MLVGNLLVKQKRDDLENIIQRLVLNVFTNRLKKNNPE